MAIFIFIFEVTRHFRYRISQHPEVEEKLMKELESRGLSSAKGAQRRIIYADLSELTYMEAVIKVRHFLQAIIGSS